MYIYPLFTPLTYIAQDLVEEDMITTWGITSYVLILVACIVYGRLPEFSFTGDDDAQGRWTDLIKAILANALQPRFARDRTRPRL